MPACDHFGQELTGGKDDRVFRLDGVKDATRTFLGAPPTPRFGVSEATMKTPGANNAPRERDGLFEK